MHTLATPTTTQLARTLLCVAACTGMIGCGPGAACPTGFVEEDGVCRSTAGLDAQLADASTADAPGLDAYAPELDAFVRDTSVAPGDTGEALDAAPMDDDAASEPPDAALEPIDGCTPATFYADADGDGFGNPAVTMLACGAAPSGYVADATDCDDTCVTCHPGGTEVCDGRDQNCAGGIDEGVLLTFHLDCDGDGYTPSGASTMQACSAPGLPGGCASGAWRGAPSAQTDCADGDARARPFQTAFFATPVQVVGGYDFDCSGTTTREFLTTGGTCPAASDGSGNCGMTGWSGTTAPACGAAATYIECYRGSPLGGGMYTCSRVMSSQTQACR